MNNLTLVMVSVLAAIAMLSAAVVVLPIQQASAQDTNLTSYNPSRIDVVAPPSVAM